ncbi:MAG: elongation factor G [Dehalococcoidia bacterium]|nr:elongation factor G [Dehalococcoidia bacterium]MDH4367853.1 elongation factor G [Dehalococcoidia bacterium]
MPIRNVVLLSHQGAGKTSLAELMLFTSGTIQRLGSVADGTTTSDYDPLEVERRMGINLSLLPVQWQEMKLNIIDTPGYADFIGEARSGLRVAEGAIIVICAASGVEVGTEQMWSDTEKRNLPRLIFVNKMDRDNADFLSILKGIQSKLSPRCVPVQLPIGSQKDFQGIIDLVTMKAYIGADSQEAEIPSALREQAEASREKLVEAAVEVDDELINKYLGGESINNEEIFAAIRKSTIAGRLVPVFAGSALKGVGSRQVLNGICSYLPSPEENGAIVAKNPSTGNQEEIKPDSESPLAVLVFKTTADPYVGKLSYFRVYSGVISGNSQVWNANRNSMERIGQLFTMLGKNQQTVPQVAAGDIGAVAKLGPTITGDTLCAREHPVILQGIEFPKANFSMAIQPQAKSDLDKMSTVLPRICEEDPSLQTRREADTNEFIISGVGDNHLEITKEKIRRKFGVEVKLDLPKIPYKETITVSANAEYKHKKQTGGHGQYGHVLLELEPLPRGGGFEFVKKIVGGAIPQNYIPSVEKGVNEAKQEGVLAGYPVVDVRVSLYDGSFHPVDSSDIAFKIAGAQALKKGLSQAQPVLIEPIMKLNITVPESHTGDITSDLNTKRGRVLGMNPGNGINVIEAQAPYAELLRYALNLRSLTQGRGSFVMEFDHYEEVPAHLSQKIIAEKKTAS